MKKQSENIWLGSFFGFLFLMILSTLFCAPCYCQKVGAETYAASQGIATGTLADGSKFVGAIDPNDYMDYKFNVPATGSYAVAFRVSSGQSTSLQFKSGSTTLANVLIPNQFSYDKYVTMTATVNLTAGTQVFRITTATGGFNVNWFSITPISGVPPVVIPPVVIPPVVTPPPTTGGYYTKAQIDSLFNTLLDIQFNVDSMKIPKLRKWVQTKPY